MTDDRDPPDFRLQPFPVHRPESPFPPLYESLPPGPGDPYSDWNQNADAHDLPTRENRLTALGRFAFPPAPPLDDEGVAARDRRRRLLIGPPFLGQGGTGQNGQQHKRGHGPTEQTMTHDQFPKTTGPDGRRTLGCSRGVGQGAAGAGSCPTNRASRAAIQASRTPCRGISTPNTAS